MRHKKPYKHKKSVKRLEAEQRQLEEQEDQRIQAKVDKIVHVITWIMIGIAVITFKECRDRGGLGLFGD